jgi:hypothetical protein|tara:strand:- start:3913 stop:4200 length:288 start_codon:yes stop_codon:yes gene_type:complete
MPRPNQQMRANAKRALRLRNAAPASRKGMTSVGLQRANQFAKGENVSLDTVRRTFSFLSRAKAYYKPGRNTPGTQAYLGWGGNAGLSWAKRILKK